jgi:capsular exopolysaccharide synthesis family protein
VELRDYLRILRAHWVGIVLLTALGLAVALGWNLVQPRLYTATASGYVAATGMDGSANATLVGDQLARSKVTSYLDIGSWRSVAEYAIQALGLTASPEALVTRVEVSNPLDTVVIHVAATANDPVAARDLAETWIRGMTAEIDSIEGDGTAGSAAVTLVPGDSARLPTSPSSPNTTLDLVLGGLIGLALGIAYAVVRSVLDRRIGAAPDIERETGASVVGTLPLERALDTPRRVHSFGITEGDGAYSAHAEAMRELRTNLQFMDVDHPPRSIVVTSPLPGDGKSTTAVNLALSLAAGGQRVAFIDADLRRPRGAALFSLPDGAGLTDVLAGRAKVGDVAHSIGASHNLLVLTAGRIPPNPSEVLGSHRMRDLITGLSQHGLVIIDSPPLLPVADAAVLSTAADGALVVISAKRTTFEQLQQSLDNLTKVNGRVLGVVLNKVAPRDTAAAQYQYQYASPEPAGVPTVRAAAQTVAGRTRRSGG